MIKGYRTIIFNAVMAVVLIVSAVVPDAELPDEAAISDAVVAFEMAVGLVWGVGSMILRAVTDSPIFKKER